MNLKEVKIFATFLFLACLFVGIELAFEKNPRLKALHAIHRRLLTAVAPPDSAGVVLVCVIITYKPTSETLKFLAYQNTAQMYASLRYVKAFLAISAGTSSSWERDVWMSAGHDSNTILNGTITNEHGTPFLSSLLSQVELACPASTPFVAYANADIMFNHGLTQTMQALSGWTTAQQSGLLMAVGRRSNHQLSGKLTTDQLTNASSALETTYAQDYFIMSRSLIDWNILPSFVIGRRAYDNALVDWVYHNAILLDVTNTVLALHQTTADGNRAGHSVLNKDAEFNVQLPGIAYDHGSTDHAHYKTTWSETTPKHVRIHDAATNQQVWPPRQELSSVVATEMPAASGLLFKMHRYRKYSSLRPVTKLIGPFKSDASNAYPTGTRWAVITSIFLPTNLIQTILWLDGWCTVVVADLKSPTESEYLQALTVAGVTNPTCFVYLTPDRQESLDYNIIKHVPYNSFGRKNVGYVFAMHHGARVIYDTDDDNELADTDLLQYWAISQKERRKDGVVWLETGSNPYIAHGGVDGIWPRGLPLDRVLDPLSWHHSRQLEPVQQEQDACIVQSLADREPDVDAIYRLTNKNYPTTFASQARKSASIVKQGQMAPFNAQATLFFRDAFGTMLLPITVHGRVSDIWRGFMAQAILKSRCSLIFTPPWVTQVRNSHNNLADMNAETPLYQQASSFVQYLQHTNYQDISQAMIDAYEHGLVEEEDVRLAEAWQADVARAQKSMHARNPETPLPINLIMFRHVLILMGRKTHLKNWINRIVHPTQHLQHVDLVFGMFDHTASIDDIPECQSSFDRVTCVSVAGTTWTQGRNLLAKSALDRERTFAVKYSWWTFADADVNLHCVGPDSSIDCVAMYDSFLSSLPDSIMAATIIGTASWAQIENTAMINLQAFDAIWNSIRREAVPVMLPYRTEEDANSWWSSQAIFWNRLQCLAPHYAVTPMFIKFSNDEHNPYPRNPRNIPREQQIARLMMGKLSTVLKLAPPEYEQEFQEARLRPLPLALNEPLSDIFRLCLDAFAQEFYSFAVQ